jgi:hypothetical protein
VSVTDSQRYVRERGINCCHKRSQLERNTRNWSWKSLYAVRSCGPWIIHTFSADQAISLWRRPPTLKIRYAETLAGSKKSTPNQGNRLSPRVSPTGHSFSPQKAQKAQISPTLIKCISISKFGRRPLSYLLLVCTCIMVFSLVPPGEKPLAVGHRGYSLRGTRLM